MPQQGVGGEPPIKAEIGVASSRGAVKPILLGTGTRLAKTAYRGAFVGIDVKHRVEFRDLQKIPDFLRQLQQLQIAALILYRRKAADQLANPGAVDVVDVRKVQQDLLSLVFEKPANRLAQQRAAVTKSNASAQIHNGNWPSVAMRGS